MKSSPATKGIPTKRKPSEPALPTRKSRRIQGKQSEDLALPDSWPANDAPKPDYSVESLRIGRLDPNLTAEAINLSGSNGRMLLDSIADGLDERGT